MSAPNAAIKESKGGSARPSGAGPGSVLRLTQVLPPARLWTLIVCLVLGVAAGIGAYLQPPRADPLHPPRFASPFAETWDGFLHPIERNAVFRLPRIAADLNDVALAKDGKHGWAVGSGGVILATEDGGESWSRQANGLPPDRARTALNAIALSDDGSRAWIAGDDGVILHTSDAGAHWSVQRAVNNEELRAIAMSDDGRTGYAVGGGAIILETTDGGETWRQTSTRIDPGFNLFAVAVGADGRNWIAGSAGLILKNEKGKSWDIWGIGLSVDLRAIALSDNGRKVWAIGPQGLVVSFSDINTPPRVLSGAPGLANLETIAVSPDGQRIVASGYPGTVRTSTDGGKSWSEWRSGGSAYLDGLALRGDLSQGLAVGSLGTVLRTADGGRSWLPLSRGGVNDLLSVTVSADGEQVWAVGDDRTILKSDDGGANWVPLSRSVGTVEVGTSADTVTGANTGGAVTVTGANTNFDTQATPAGTGGFDTQATSPGTGGFDTQATSPGTAGDLSLDLPQAQIPDAKNAAQSQSQALPQPAPSKAGQSLADNVAESAPVQQQTEPPVINVTPPEITTWTPQLMLPQLERFTGVWVSSSGSTATVIGENGTIRRTNDGGETWLRQGRPAYGDLEALGFGDKGERGWASGANAFLETQDGGKAWVQHPTRALRLPTLVSVSSDAERIWTQDLDVVQVSDDSGATWSERRALPADTALIAVADDGETALSSSFGGISRTTDAGKTWTQAARTDYIDAIQLLLSRDATRAWMIGRDWIAASGGDGAAWHDQYRNEAADLSSIAMSDSGRRGVVVGFGAILTTEDGGATWSDATGYRRYPAPWLYLSWVLIGLVGHMAWVRSVPKPEADFETIGDDMDSDQPVLRMDQDKLDFTPIVAALSDFIRNEETKPPVTIAINGDWGTGKSSLMSMLADSLRRAGGYPVWFNAWHHQSEQLTLVPFLQHVCTQAVPPTLSRAGLRFRLRLAWRRSLRRPVTLALALFVIALPLAFFAFHDIATVFAPAALDALKHDLASMLAPFFGDLDDAEKWVNGWTGAIEVLFNPTAGIVFWLLLLLVPGTILALDALRAFPEVPAILFATLQDKFRLSEAEAQASFRQDFSRHFDDVVHALHPQPVVVFVDDIDRCTKENAMEMLEAANFLVNAGPCFVILGLARERVEALVGLANAEFAEETALTAGADAKESRRAYARQYLEKLIQVEISVPRAQPSDLLRVLGVEVTEHGTSTTTRVEAPKPSRWLSHDRQIVAGCCALVALAAAIWLGRILPEPAPPLPPPSETVVAQATTADAVPAQPAPAEPQPGSESAPPAKNTVGGADRPGQSGFALVSFLPWLLLILAGGTVLWRVLQTPENLVVRNSPAYKRAVAEWRRLIIGRRSTPRAVKQFGNMARYAAMMMRTEDERAEITRSITLNERRRGGMPGADLDWDRIAERDVSAVTLSAIYHAEPDLLRTDPYWLFGRDWQAQLENRVEEARSKFYVGADPIPPGEQAHWQRRLAALELIGGALGEDWPPRDLDAVRKFFKYVVATFSVEEDEGNRGATAD